MVFGKLGATNHAWNIAKLDGKYYLLDTTSDSTTIGFRAEHELYYMLKGKNDGYFSSSIPENDELPEEYEKLAMVNYLDAIGTVLFDNINTAM